MAEVKWIKIVTDIFDDPKIRFIRTLPSGDTMVVIWFELLCLAGKCNQNGFLMMTDKIPYTEEMLASVFDDDIKVIQLALQTFENLSMVEIIDNRTYLTNWEKHQSAEKLATIREQTRARVARLREKAECNSNSVTEALQERYCNTDVTQQNKNKNKKGDIDKESTVPEESAHRSQKFAPPSVEEVRAYCQERKNCVDAERFVDFYSAKGWLVGKTKMKDWKACVRTWEQRDKAENAQPDRKTSYDILEYENSDVFGNFDRK